ncbi:MAG: hypothetical protein RL641_757 [Candidatus Parcubacteria bacterium]|jgi:dephospho-CoA kinase
MSTIKTKIYITGTIASGKNTVVDYLVRNQNFVPFGTRKLFEDVYKRESHTKGLAESELKDRAVLRVFANGLREKYGGDYAIKTLTGQSSFSDRTVIESVRCIDEVQFIKAFQKSMRKSVKVILVGVDALVNIRHERAITRQSALDNVSFEKFKNDEYAESMSVHSNQQNIKACIKASDILLINNGSIEELHLQIKQNILPLLRD